MSKRSQPLDWSQKLFVACLALGLMSLGAGGAVKMSRTWKADGEAIAATAAPEKAPATRPADPDEAEPAATKPPTEDQAEVPPPPKPAAEPSPAPSDGDVDEAAVAARPDAAPSASHKPTGADHLQSLVDWGAKPQDGKTGKDGGKPVIEDGEALPEHRRRIVYNAICSANAKAQAEAGDAWEEKAGEILAEYGKREGLSRSALDDIAEEGKMKGWNSGQGQADVEG